MLDWQTRARAEDLRRSGWSCAEVGRVLFVSTSTVAMWTKDLGLEPGTSLAMVRKVQRVLDDYLAGVRARDTAEALGVSRAYVHWIRQGARGHWPGIAKQDSAGRWVGKAPATRIVVRAHDVAALRRSKR